MKKIRFILFFLTSFAVISAFIFSCRQNAGKRYDIPELPSLQPPSPPKAPSMSGADTIWDFSGQLPVLPDNEEALYSYIGRNLRYPESAAKEGVQGKVFIQFCVTSKGDVTDYEVVSNTDPRLDAEALRVIKSITRFEPGYHNGKPVAVWYKVPVTFKLQ
jgi:protein TonB